MFAPRHDAFTEYFEMSQNRRTFLTTIGASAVAAVIAPNAAKAATAHGSQTQTHPRRGDDACASRQPTAAKLERIGIQLYSLRERAAADLAGVLAALSKIGYAEVEMAGYYGHAAAEVRGLLDENHLTAPSAHIGIDVIEKDPDRTFAAAHTIGHTWITVPSPAGEPKTLDNWKAFAVRLNAAGAAAKAAGFRFAYHNHDTEFRSIDGTAPWDVLMRNTDPSLVAAQIDLYHAVNGGADPLDLIARYGSRIKMLHVKDMGAGSRRMVDVGAGTIDFKTIFAHAKGIEHYFVENDQPADPLAFAANSYKYLANLEF
jgi:sugar phosphate isomerase/epimerase